MIWVGEALAAAIWCYVQTVTLVWDHFGLAERDELRRVETEALIPVTVIDDDEARHIGRNELCPCGSGWKYKRCHGA